MNVAHDAVGRICSMPDNARHQFFVANLNRPRFAAYRKRDEKSRRRDYQLGNLPFISCVTRSGREQNINATKLAHAMQPSLRCDRDRPISS